MRNKRWLRYGLASVTLMGAGLGTFLAACGDDDNVTPTPKTDSGTDGTTPGDTGAPDAPADGPTPLPDAGTPAKIFLVHAGTNLGPNTSNTGAFAGGVRVCFATATKPSPGDGDFQPTPFPALPSDGGGAAPYPGLFIGTGGPFPSSGADLEQITIRPYLMNAQSLNNRNIVGQDPSVPRCGKLLTDGGIDGSAGSNLEQNVDFWQLADIPAGTLKKEKTYILAVTGCTADAENVTPGFCGNADTGGVYTPTGQPGAGNLKILVVELDTLAGVAADEFAAAALNLSPQHETAKALPTVPNFQPLLTSDLDASTTRHPVVPAFGEVAYNRNATAPTPIAKIKGLVTSTGYFALGPAPNPDPLNQGVSGPAKLNNAGTAPPATQRTVQFATTGSTDTTELYVNGRAYTFVLVGDPTVQDANQGPRQLHYIGIPNKQ